MTRWQDFLLLVGVVYVFPMLPLVLLVPAGVGFWRARWLVPAGALLATMFSTLLLPVGDSDHQPSTVDEVRALAQAAATGALVAVVYLMQLRLWPRSLPEFTAGFCSGDQPSPTPATAILASSRSAISRSVVTPPTASA